MKRGNSKKYLTIVLIAIMVFNMVIVTSPISFAAEDDYYFESIKVTLGGTETEISDLDGKLNDNENLDFEFTWAIDNDFTEAEGKTLTYTLPEVIDWSKAQQDGDLTGNGKTYGTYEVVQVGGNYELQITFAEAADLESNVNGSIKYNVDLDIRRTDVELPYTWTVPISKTDNEVITFNASPEGGKTLEKTGARIDETDEILWTIDFNTSLDELSEPVLMDEYSSLLKYETDSLEIIELNVSSQGNVTTGAAIDLNDNTVLKNDPIFTDAPSDNDTGLDGEGLFEFNDTNKAYRIKYITTIDPDKIDYNETEFSYSNQVKLDNNAFIPPAIVDISRGYLIEKDGLLNQNYNADSIDWEIRINNANYNLKDVRVEDTLPTGLTYRDIVVEDTEGTALTVDTDYTIVSPTGDDTFTFAIDFTNDVNEEYIITYTTDIDNDLRKTQNDELSFTNQAKLIHSLGEAVPKNGQPTVAVKLGRVFYKKGQGDISYNDKKYIDWELYVNLGEADLGSDKTVIDVFSDHEYLDVTGDNITVKALTLDHSQTFDPDESNVNTQLGNLISSEADFTDFSVAYKNVASDDKETDANASDTDINKFELIFNNEVTSAYKISYRTIIQDKDQNNFTNTGSIGPGDGSGGSYGDTVTVSPTIANIYRKEVIGNGINYLTNTIDWKLTVNPIKEGINNLVITDTILADQYLKEDVFDPSIQKDGEAIDTDDYSIITNTSNETINGADITVIDSFEISFNDGVEVNEGVYTVEYQTKINPNTFGNDLDYKNQATFNWDGKTGDPLDKSAKPNLNDTAKANGRKVGSFDDTNEKIINWTIDLNYFSKTMTDIRLDDTLPDGLVLVEDSVKVYDSTLKEDGTISAADTVSENDYTINENNDSFSIDFNGIHESPYRVEYSTILDGISKENYENTATLSNGESFTYTVTYDDYDAFVSKNSSRNGTESVDFEVLVNQSRSTIENLVLKDTLSQGLEIDLDSFEIKEETWTFEDLFVVTTEPKALITEPTVVVITAKDGVIVDDEMTITYEASILEEEVVGKKVSNSITLSGDQINFGTKSDTVEEDFSSIQGFGSGTGETGGFTLTKVDADDPSVKLEGAKYELRRGEKLLGTLETDENGEISVDSLLYLEHSLTEIEAPEGYKLDETTHNTFTVDNTEEIIKLTNEKNRFLVIKKVDQSNNSRLLSGAEFEIYDSSDQLVDTVTTDSNGTVELILDKGDYTVQEVTAPNNYYLNDEVQSITIDASTDSFELVFENRRIRNNSSNDDDDDEPEENDEDITEEEIIEEPTEEESNDPSDEPDEPEEEETVVITPEDVPKDGNVIVPEDSTPEVDTPPKNGTVEIDDDGNWTYTPDPGFIGDDDFVIKIKNPDGTDEDILVEITVEEVPLGVGELPQTGDSIPWRNYILGGLIALLGIVLLTRRD